MNITRFAVENNRTTLVLLLVILLAGSQAYLNMPRDYDPGFIIRNAQVVTQFPGASPERVELLVSDKIEKAVKEIPELDFVKSESRTGISIINVNIKESYSDMRPIWDSLRRKIDDVAKELPDGIIGPTVNDEFGDVFGIVLALTGEGFSYAELKEVADEARNAFLSLPEAAKVDIFGAQDERIFVEYNHGRLTELGLSPHQLSQALSSLNIVVPGGYITVGPERIALEPSGNFESIEDIRRTIIPLSGSKEVLYLEDIADVSRGYVDPPSKKSRAQVDDALILAISMRQGGNIIALGEQVTSRLSQLQSTYPIGIEFNKVTFAPTEVDQKVNDFISNLLQAVLVVAAVMLLSLGLRTGLIVAVLIPCTMVTAILVMSVFSIGLDQISLAALIIALGMLVDNGIVMSENIMVQMASGKRAIQAAIDSAAELRIPLLTSSLTTAAAFLPIFLAESSTGEYTAPLFKVVTITLLSSWVISLTVIPLLCVYFLKVEPASAQADNYDTRFYRSYRAVLMLLLKHRFITIVVIAAVFVFSLSLVKFIPKVFFPPSDRTYFKMDMKLPLGTDIITTDAMVRDIETFINTDLKVKSDMDDGVTDWVSYIGSGGPRFLLTHSPEPSSSNYALMIINTSSAHIIDELMIKIEQYALDRFPDLTLKLKRFENGAPIANPVEVRISGKDSDTLFGLVDNLKAKLEQTPGVKSVNDDWGRRIKKLVVKINQARARRAGVSSQDIAVSLQTGLSGLELTQYREGDQVIPVVMRSIAADRQDIGKLEMVSVYSQVTGNSVPLKQVADIEVVWEPAKILRRQGLKTVTVGAQLNPGVTATSVFNEIVPWLQQEKTHWGQAYEYELGGEAETSGKANESIAAKLPIAIFIIVFLLVAQFNSIRRPIIILMTIPLGITGVIFGLLLAQSFFGFMTLLGIISLAGIVINNAIVLLERIRTEIEVNKLIAQRAIIEAAQRRLRPILLTTATTVFGLMPLYLGGGEMWEPMAVAIMAGLLFSTLLTLGIVPVLYALLFRVSYKGYTFEKV